MNLLDEYVFMEFTILCWISSLHGIAHYSLGVVGGNKALERGGSNVKIYEQQQRKNENKELSER